MTNIEDTVQLLIDLGFTMHAEKYILAPTQEIIYLEFVINTLTLTLTLTQEKKLNNFRYMSTCSR